MSIHSTMTRDERKQVEELRPIIERMNPERARKLAQALETFEGVAKEMSRLYNAMNDAEEMDAEAIARYVEGMAPADAKILSEWLEKKEKEIADVFSEIPIIQDELFHTLSTVAIDVWNDAPRDEDGALIEVAAKD